MTYRARCTGRRTTRRRPIMGTIELYRYHPDGTYVLDQIVAVPRGVDRIETPFVIGSIEVLGKRLRAKERT